MSSLKSLLVLLALATIGYGVYTKLRQPSTELGWNTAGSVDGMTGGPDTSEEPFHGGIDLPSRFDVPSSGTPLPGTPISGTPSDGLAPLLGALSPDRFGGGSSGSPATMISPSIPVSQLSAGPALTGLNTTGSLSGHIATVPSIPGSPANPASPTNALTTDPLRSMVGDPESELTAQQSAQWDVKFRRVMAEIYADSEQLAQPGNGEAGLRELTVVYRKWPLTPAQRHELSQVLDGLAATVIWDMDCYLKDLPPIMTDGGFSICDVAIQCGVGTRLLLQLNGLEDVVTHPGDPLPAGIPLKTLRGPFEAEISSEARELTVYVDGMYAGRFTLDFGRDLDVSKIPLGTYPLFRKQPASPNDLSPGIDLATGDTLRLRGVSDSASLQRGDAVGQILFSRQDITDLYDILTLDEANRFTSTVTIRR